MRTRRLGATDLHLTEIGFGGWAIGGGGWRFGWGPQDDGEALAAIHRALELGINWIDTAPVYGLGHSERVVARALQARSQKPIIATKCSLVWDRDGAISSSLARESVRRECEGSLRRLGTDCIDLYQIHWPNDDAHIEEGWEQIGRLIDEGKIRYGGVSNFQVHHLKRAQAIRPIASLQPPYSMLRRGAEGGLLEYCSTHGIGVVAYSPMMSGLLSGSFDLKRVAADDWRRSSDEFKEPNLSLNLQLVDQLRPLAEKYGKTVGQLAIAWVLRASGVCSVIVGARRPSQVDQIVGGAQWAIDPLDLEQIDSLLVERNKRAAEIPAQYVP
jgi:aryl-alcohol dehydrogenase-like predicted oxidoreductase